MKTKNLMQISWFLFMVHDFWKKPNVSSITFFFDYARVFPLREYPFMISRQMYNSTAQKMHLTKFEDKN